MMDVPQSLAPDVVAPAVFCCGALDPQVRHVLVPVEGPVETEDDVTMPPSDAGSVAPDLGTPAQTIQIGQVVQLSGLQRCPALNGRDGLVQASLPHGRFAIRVAGEDKSVSVA